MAEVSVRELKNRLTHYLRRLEQGEQFIVTRRGKQVAILSPAKERDNETQRKLRQLVAAGIISWSGGKPKGLRPGVKLTPGPSASDIVVQGRE